MSNSQATRGRSVSTVYTISEFGEWKEVSSPLPKHLISSANTLSWLQSRSHSKVGTLAKTSAHVAPSGFESVLCHHKKHAQADEVVPMGRVCVVCPNGDIFSNHPFSMALCCTLLATRLILDSQVKAVFA